LIELLNHPDAATSQRVTTAMLQMKKIEIDELKRVAAH
jgi:predicted 3-demethylubiquinone-9 3-methyltransferase (glyoxalase superfamily)